jgi:hypothetical protein
MDVILSMDACYVLYECDEYCDVQMDVLDLDVHINVLYIVCANCASFVILVVLVILFSTNFLKPRLIYDSLDGPS